MLSLIATGCSSSAVKPGEVNSGSTGGPVTQVEPSRRVAAPIVSGPELGKTTTFSTASITDRVLVLNVWGSWCQDCRAEEAALQQASTQTVATAQFVGIDTREASQATPMAYVRAKAIGYPSIYDPAGTQLVKFAGTLPLFTVPSTLVIDTQSRIAARIVGPVDAETLIQLIDDTAQGR